MILTYKYRIKDNSARKALARHAYAVDQVWCVNGCRTNIVMGRPCKRGHDKHRYRVSRACVECQRAAISIEGQLARRIEQAPLCRDQLTAPRPTKAVSLNAEGARPLAPTRSQSAFKYSCCSHVEWIEARLSMADVTERHPVRPIRMV